MTTTSYVITFEADSGERITFRVGRGVYRKYFIGNYEGCLTKENGSDNLNGFEMTSLAFVPWQLDYPFSL